MSELVISYSRSERDRIAPIAARLEEIGVDVWFDRKIPAGRSFDEVIQEELRKAKAVLVCWSAEAVASRWVKGEATEADELGIYLPVKITECRIGIPFNRLQTEDLSNWTGDHSDATWLKVVDRLAQMIGREAISEAARAFASGDDKARHAFAQRYIDEPVARKIWEEAERRYRERYNERLNEARTAIASRMETERAAKDAALVLLSGEFEAWLADERRGAAKSGFPDPMDAVDSTRNAEKELRAQVAALSESLSHAATQQQETAQERDTALAEANRFGAALDAEKANAAAQTAARGLPRGRAAAAALGLAILAAAAGAAIDRRASDAPALRAQVAGLTGSLGGAKTEAARLQQQLDAAAANDQALNAKLKEVADNLADNRGSLDNAIAKIRVVEEKFVRLATGCTESAIFADSFFGNKGDWRQRTDVTYGPTSLIMSTKGDGRKHIYEMSNYFENVRVACARFRINSIDVNNNVAFGFYFWSTEKYFYTFNVESETGNALVKVLTRAENKWSTLRSASFENNKVSKDVDHTLSIRFDAGEVKFYLDGSIITTYPTSDRPVSAGYGLFSQSDKDATVEASAFGLLR